MRTPTPVQLHIGGTTPHPDWIILDVEDRPGVDVVGNAAHLEQFADASVDAIYASHVLEHFNYRLNDELTQVLREWYRVLKPDAPLYISVPNLEVLCHLYIDPELTPEDQFFIMRMMFGGQFNEHDVHRVGFNLTTLGHFLFKAGFQSIEMVDQFGLFEDASTTEFRGISISLNVIAYKIGRL